jgi:hypothetical protein
LRPFEPHDSDPDSAAKYTQGAIDVSRFGYTPISTSGKQPDRDLRRAGGCAHLALRTLPAPRTGKRLPQKVSEIVIQHRALLLSIFPPDAAGMDAEQADHPTAAEEGMRLAMMTKDPDLAGCACPPQRSTSAEKTFGIRFRTH